MRMSMYRHAIMLLKSDFLVAEYRLLPNLHHWWQFSNLVGRIDQNFMFGTASLLSGKLGAPSPDSTSLLLCAVSADESEWVPTPGTPAERQWPVVVRLLLSLNRRSRFKIHKSLEKKSGVMGPETKSYCAGEDQQQFNRPTALSGTAGI